ncbi:MAG: hypothetical protein K0S53_3231 [Bacteroidetes bacterium]|nr:hypothetical protein [Bacteroidota bacterium]
MNGLYCNHMALKSGISFTEIFKKVVGVILFFLAFNLKAQTGMKIPTDVKANPNSATGKLDVEFKNEKQVDNLLVIVTDSLGRTIFLENLYRFKGPYKKSIELSEGGKGSFSLQVIKDAERIHKKLSIK